MISILPERVLEIFYWWRNKELPEPVRRSAPKISPTRPARVKATSG
jgi:hypothetical protein